MFKTLIFNEIGFDIRILKMISKFFAFSILYYNFIRYLIKDLIFVIYKGNFYAILCNLILF